MIPLYEIHLKNFLSIFLMEDEKIELLAQCIAELLVDITPKKTHVYQDYINHYLLSRIPNNIIKRINSDEVIKEVIGIHHYFIFKSNFIDHPSNVSLDSLMIPFYATSPNSYKKYISDWEYIAYFLKNKSDKWWRSLSLAWFKKTGDKIPLAKHYQRQLERQSVYEYLPLIEDVQYIIITYL